MVSAGVSTGTLTEQAGSVDPDGQLLPAAAVDSVLIRTLLPVSGVLTVTLPLMVTEPPTGIFPVQVRPVLVTERIPDVAVESPLELASSRTSVTLPATVIPV